jgi:hypothetical protein
MNRLGRWIALMLMALGLALQAGAPAQAFAMIQAAADPLSAIPICSAHQGAQAPGSPAPEHKGVCAACVVCCSPSAMVLNPPLVVPAPVRQSAVVHIRFARPWPHAPPARSPKARDPPQTA